MLRLFGEITLDLKRCCIGIVVFISGSGLGAKREDCAF